MNYAETIAACLFAFTVAGCSGQSAPAKADAQEAAAPAEQEDPEAKDAVAQAAHEDAEGDHAGCIYAEGEKDDDDPACPHGPGEAAAAGSGDGHFGQPFEVDSEQTLAQAIESELEAPVKVAGVVEAVCQKKGCWMVLKDQEGTQSARVLMKDHGFAVPMDSRGKSAIVEGTLTSRTFTEAQVKHLEKDAGKDPEAVEGTRTEHVLTATAVEIKS